MLSVSRHKRGNRVVALLRYGIHPVELLFALMSSTSTEFEQFKYHFCFTVSRPLENVSHDHTAQEAEHCSVFLVTTPNDSDSGCIPRLGIIVSFWPIHQDKLSL